MQNNYPKQALREEMKQRLKSTIDSDEDGTVRLNFEKKIIKSIRNSNLFKTSEVLLSYHSMYYEAPTLLLNTFITKKAKTVALPKINEKVINFYVCKNITAESLQANSFGIYEPKENKNLDITSFLSHTKAQSLLVIVPGLAFTKEGDRLGRGKGFYDTFLTNFYYNQVTNKELNITLIGLAFSFQILDSIPIEDHDIPMDYILTENGLHRC